MVEGLDQILSLMQEVIFLLRRGGMEENSGV